MIAFAALALLLQDSVYPGERKDWLNSPPKAVFETSKRSSDMETCLVDTLTVLGTPMVFRSGPENTVIAVSMPGANAYLASISVARTKTGSRVQMRLRAKGWDDRIRARIQACL